MVGDCILRDAAICGEESTVRRLVHGGADANAIIGFLILGSVSLEDFNVANARTSAPGRLSTLSFLLQNQFLSLYTLNAPHSLFQGLTPLGMATYLNRLDFVTALLEKGDGLVLLDGVDSQRATPIMYAARDGHIEILQYLIRKGARTDSVDCHQRSVLFHAVSAPLCLRVCELNVRLQRAESLLSHSNKRKLKLTLKYDGSQYNTVSPPHQQHPVATLPADFRSPVKRLVSAITSSDLPSVHSLLFPSIVSQSSPSSTPALVNLPDEKGWAPIHYCVIAPRANVSILDTLYLAGADLSLYTTDNMMTPLHILARHCGTSNDASFQMYAFILHLVRDLGAPLDAVNLNGETCIHVAARRGRCVDVLMAFLECDTDGVVRSMRDNNGRTALEVAKQEFRMAFEQDGRSMRPNSTSSTCTIKPSHSASSLATTWSARSSNSSSCFEDELQQFEQFPRPISREKKSMRTSALSTTKAERILGDLTLISEQLQMARAQQSNGTLTKVDLSMTSIDNIEELLQHSGRSSFELLERLRKLVNIELEGLHAAQDVHSALEQLIIRLEYQVRADEEEERDRTPSPTSFCGSATTPSLVTSASSSRHSSFASFTSADRAALLTPTCSPRSSIQNIRTPKPSSRRSGSMGGDHELDFACALASGNATRRRRSALSAIFTVRGSTSTILSEPDSSLETGVNLVSIPPERAPEEAQSPIQGGCDSWLDPYVRRANSDLFQKHLANLLEIEQTLFGSEDREREKTPSPGCGPGELEREAVCWRAGVDALQEDDGNFLEMGDEEDSVLECGEEYLDGEERDGIDQFLDLFVADDKEANRSSTLEVSPTSKDSNGPSLVLEILGMARREVCAVEEAITTARRSVETTQRYISQAEGLTKTLFQKMEHAAQATRLAHMLDNLCIGDVTSTRRVQGRGRSSMIQARAPVNSPTVERLLPNTKTFVFPLPTVMENDSLKEDNRGRSLKALTSRAASTQTTDVSVEDDLRALQRLLVRKIPVWLDATAYDVDKASLWIGVVQAVVQDIQRTRL